MTVTNKEAIEYIFKELWRHDKKKDALVQAMYELLNGMMATLIGLTSSLA